MQTSSTRAWGVLGVLMVAWYWLIVAFSVGGSLGFLGGAMLIAGRQDNRAD